MNGFWYQLKIMVKDKMSIISFLFPIMMILVVNYIEIGPNDNGEKYHFALVSTDKSIENKLNEYGIVTMCKTEGELNRLVSNHKNDVIGVIFDKNKYNFILSGFESTHIRDISEQLEKILNSNIKKEIILIPKVNLVKQFKIFIVSIILVTSLFLGLTFNAMNLISEKEDGVIFINNILPLTSAQYLFQKIMIGYCGSIVITILTGLLSFDSMDNILKILPIIILGAFVTSIIGSILGKISANLIEAIVYIKVTMVVFISIPLIGYMFTPENIKKYLNILPSYTFFSGVMGVLNGSNNIINYTGIMILHCLVWFILYIVLFSKKKWCVVNRI